MKKVFYLSSCSTCQRILKELNIDETWSLQDIKKNPLSIEDLTSLYQMSKSYENLFNKRAQLYKSRNLKAITLTEEDYRKLLLENYTFLKRPVFILNDKIFIGNSKKTIEKLKENIKK